MATRPRNKVTEAATDLVEQIAPASSEAELEEMIARVPETHRRVVHEAMRHGAAHYERLFAAAAAAVLVQQELQPNSAVTLWPATLAPGANATPGLVYQLVPFLGTAAQGPYQFVRGQRFFGVVTGSTDVTAGWRIVSGTMKMSTDAISGMNYGDSSFDLFQTDMVQGRMITGEYERHEIIEQITFTAAAVLGNVTPQPMLEGLTIQFWDNRCREGVEGLKWLSLASDGEDFPELVRDLMASANGGIASARLRRYRRR